MGVDLKQMVLIVSGLKCRFCENLNKNHSSSFCASLGPHNGKNIHMDKHIFKLFFALSGPLNGYFCWKPNMKFFLDSQSHSIGEKIKSKVGRQLHGLQDKTSTTETLYRKWRILEDGGWCRPLEPGNQKCLSSNKKFKVHLAMKLYWMVIQSS